MLIIIFKGREKSLNVFAASNFVLLRYPKKEAEFRRRIKEEYGYCGRLFSYFFEKENQTVYKQMFKEGENNNNDNNATNATNTKGVKKEL